MCFNYYLSSNCLVLFVCNCGCVSIDFIIGIFKKNRWSFLFFILFDERRIVGTEWRSGRGARETADGCFKL